MKPLSPWDSLNPVQQGEAMASATMLVFALTYVGMALGRVPGLRVDRSDIAMLGAVALVAMGAIPADQSLMSKTYLKSDHFSGGGSFTSNACAWAHDRTNASGGEIWTSDYDFADTLFQID